MQLLGALTDRPEPALVRGDKGTSGERSPPAPGPSSPEEPRTEQQPQTTRAGDEDSATATTAVAEEGSRGEGVTEEWVLEDTEGEEGDSALDAAVGQAQPWRSPPTTLPQPAQSLRQLPSPRYRSPSRSARTERQLAPLNVGSVICTVVIHLECQGSDESQQSQTTVVLVEVPSRGKGGGSGGQDATPRAPIVRLADQVLLIDGCAFHMVSTAQP